MFELYYGYKLFDFCSVKVCYYIKKARRKGLKLRIIYSL